MGKIKILLVDDDEMIRIYFRDVVWIHGLDRQYDLEVTSSLEKAEEMVRNPKTRPHILFLDLVVPVKEGERSVSTPEASFDLLKKIKEDPELRDIKVVIFSAHGEKSFQDEAKRLGAAGYLKKDESMPRDLIAFMEKICKKP